MLKIGMKEGPLKDVMYDGVFELLDAQAELRGMCAHDETRIESGVCGPLKRRWRRERCTYCQAVVAVL